MTEPELYLAVWADEEDDRFPVGLFGSGVCLGTYTVTVDDLMRMRPWLGGHSTWPDGVIQARWDNFADDDLVYETEAELAAWPEARQRALLTRFLDDWVRSAEGDSQTLLNVVHDVINNRLPDWAGVFESGDGLWGDALELALSPGHTLEELEEWLNTQAEGRA